MKYIVLLGDGMADCPVPALGGRTPLEAANKPNMDFIAQNGDMGLVKTIPDGMPPGSDVANLSVFGYEPDIYYSGRSPFEAASMGISMSDTDIALRCNLVTLSSEEPYEEKVMADYCAGEITTGEARELIEAISAELNSEIFSFYPGISYRHCLIWKDGEDGVSFTPPHDISGKKIASFLPKGEKSDIFISLMKKSEKILKNHPVNQLRIKNGLNPATSIWLWGQGRKPKLKRFADKYNLTGSVISAVDLIRGIGILAGLKPVHVEGATGNLHTNYTGKAKAALNELENGSDFVYIHVEAPDECGHQGLIEGKVQSIEKIDSELLAPLLDGLAKWDYSILLLPDHPTPISTRTHSREPVPFAIYRNTGSMRPNNNLRFTEKDAAATGVFIEQGHKLIDRLLI
ncbi:MAG: cofactor-independent phosphoglycerate mutase [Clostridiaceae bacterium]|nr:cofactor-independent phosphoglycerate mutase [Clostridiaceae bacterium]